MPVRLAFHSRRRRDHLEIASSPTQKGYLLFTVNKVGAVTTVSHNMKEGEILGVRGPLGNSYPLEELEGPKV